MQPAGNQESLVPSQPIDVAFGMQSWAAQYDTWLLIKMTPTGVVSSVLFFGMQLLPPVLTTGTVLGTQLLF